MPDNWVKCLVCAGSGGIQLCNSCCGSGIIGDEHTCDDCSGCGSILGIDDQCWSCGGCGKSGRYDAVPVGNTYINWHYLQLMKAELPDIKLAFNESSAGVVYMRFNDGVGAIMPMKAPK